MTRERRQWALDTIVLWSDETDSFCIHRRRERLGSWGKMKPMSMSRCRVSSLIKWFFFHSSISSRSSLPSYPSFDVTRDSWAFFACLRSIFFAAVPSIHPHRRLHDDVENHRHVQKKREWEYPSFRCTLNKLTIKYHRSIIIGLAAGACEDAEQRKRHSDRQSLRIVWSGGEFWRALGWRNFLSFAVMCEAIWISRVNRISMLDIVDGWRERFFISSRPAERPESDGFLNTRWFIIVVDSISTFHRHMHRKVGKGIEEIFSFGESD